MFNWISSAGRTKELIQRMIIVLISSCTNNDATIQVSYAMNVILRFDKMFFFLLVYSTISSMFKFNAHSNRSIIHRTNPSTFPIDTSIAFVNQSTRPSHSLIFRSRYSTGMIDY